MQITTHETMPEGHLAERIEDLMKLAKDAGLRIDHRQGSIMLPDRMVTFTLELLWEKDK